ncbi:hypothetical protein OKW21_005549 [Catalinimonas alkaloidigena]|uniref:hypothetical protein n=1 Tax=Catalinimonas alkaloidigena TaxID=1075417 RepID=UPI0024064801|nr:hypothetical protein [Catalinimonas alkaloidigena]MDF9800286.1 hypothetical protein [Catalinimonas alkaloidigena]
MSKAQKSANKPLDETPPASDVAPSLCIDFILKENLMFLIIRNLSVVAATDVRISFSQELSILGGSKLLSKLSVFHKLRYLAPYKEMEVFLDPAESFLSQFEDKNTVITITVAYAAEQGKRIKQSITHDLAIYLDLPTTLKHHHND